MSPACSHEDLSGPALCDRPAPLAPDGTPIDIDVFRAWLQSKLDVAELGDALADVVARGEPPKLKQLDELAEAVATACHGAYVFEYIDPRAAIRAGDAAVRKAANKMRKGLGKVHRILKNNPVQLTLAARFLESSLRGRYDNEFKIPWPQEPFVLDFLELLAKPLDSMAPRGAHHLPHVTCHGCLDYLRPIQGQKVRQCNQMLAFNLELLFRSASTGKLIRFGSMPGGGDPHRPLVAMLVSTLFPEAEDGPAITYEWVANSVKSILKDNPMVQVVAWPSGRDQVGFDTWYAPIEPHE